MRRILFATLLLCLWGQPLVHADTRELSTIIETFIARHYPDATSHLWVINGTQWDGDEMIVDVFTYVREKQEPATVESRYLLLIVDGRLTAAQRIPLEDGPECQPEQQA